MKLSFMKQQKIEKFYDAIRDFMSQDFTRKVTEVNKN